MEQENYLQKIIDEAKTYNAAWICIVSKPFSDTETGSTRIMELKKFIKIVGASRWYCVEAPDSVTIESLRVIADASGTVQNPIARANMGSVDPDAELHFDLS